MKNKIISVLLVMLLCISFATTAYAFEAEEYFVLDEADLLTDHEEKALSERLHEISYAHNAQIVIATVDSLDGEDIDDYLESMYDSMGFGYGAKHDGVLLLVAMNIREFRILSNGFAAEAIDPDIIDKITDAITDDLSIADYADAFDTFADECEYYINGHLNGFPFDFTKNLVIALVIGLAVAFAVTGSWKKQLKSVSKKAQANVYVKAGSLKITQSGDYFMYRTLNKTAREKSSSSSGSSSRSTGGGKF